MAATTLIHSFHGGSPGTGADITSIQIRFKRADNDTVDALFPVPIPTSGTNYSWRKHTKLQIVTAPANQISNLRWFSSGTALGTGVVHLATTTGTYVQGSSSDDATPISGGVDSAINYPVGTPLVVNSGVVADSTDSFPCYAGAGKSQDFVVQQMAIDTTASAGTSGARSFSKRYDES